MPSAHPDTITPQQHAVPDPGHLLGQLDAEIGAATAGAINSGWTASGVMAMLMPLSWALISQLSARQDEPKSVGQTGLLLFVQLWLLVDSIGIVPEYIGKRFGSRDVRGMIQWTDLLNYRVNAIDIIRYLVLLGIITCTNIGFRWYVTLPAAIFYALLFLSGLIAKALELFPILIPYYPIISKNNQACVVMFCVGVITLAGSSPPLVSGSQIHVNDLLLTGLAASIVYLLRILFVRPKTQYVRALEEIRYNLAMATIATPVAKQQLATVKKGMTVDETIQDYTGPLRLVLGMMRSEVQAALETFPAKAGGDLSGSLGSTAKQSLEREEHCQLFCRHVEEFHERCRSLKFRFANLLMRKFRRHYFGPLSRETRNAVRDSFNSLEGVCQSGAELWERYQRAEADLKGAHHACRLGDKNPFELPESLIALKRALLESPVV